MDNLNTAPDAGQSLISATGNPAAAAAATAAVGAPASTSAALTDGAGNPTDYQIALWAKEHGRKIKVVEVDGKLVCFKHPTRQIVEAANEVLTKTKKAFKYAEVIMSNCQLNFTQETKDDDELFYALTSRIDDVITSYTAALKN